MCDVGADDELDNNPQSDNSKAETTSKFASTFALEELIKMKSLKLLNLLPSLDPLFYRNSAEAGRLIFK